MCILCQQQYFVVDLAGGSIFHPADLDENRGADKAEDDPESA